MPSIERNGPGSCAACRMTRTVAASRVQCAAPPRAAGVVGGIPQLVIQAASATATISPATAAEPCRVAITMPAIVPRRIAIKDPASTSALPSSSSSGARRSGRIAYLSGPKNAATTPITNSSASSTVALPARTPPAAASITRDLDQLDQANQPRLVRLVRNLAGGRRAQEKRQHEEPGGERNHDLRRKLSRRIRPVGDHQHQRVAQCIVVERRQELRREQRSKARRDEQPNRAIGFALYLRNFRH